MSNKNKLDVVLFFIGLVLGIIASSIIPVIALVNIISI